MRGSAGQSRGHGYYRCHSMPSGVQFLCSFNSLQNLTQLDQHYEQIDAVLEYSFSRIDVFKVTDSPEESYGFSLSKKNIACNEEKPSFSIVAFLCDNERNLNAWVEAISNYVI